MNPSPAGRYGSAADILNSLAVALAADSALTGLKTLTVISARSPQVVRIGEDTGEDLLATSSRFIDMLLMSLRSDVELPWHEYEKQTRAYGQLQAAQGIPLETLLDMLAVYRRATIELITQPIEGTIGRDEIFALAHSRLEGVIERLTTCVVGGYLAHLDAEHRARESELYGLAAIVTSMGRSLDMTETAEVALAETLAALRMSAGALWSRERSNFKLVQVVGLDAQEVNQFTRETGPHVKATVTAIGRSESRVDRGLGGEWNALRAQLRVRGRVVGVMTVGTRVPRVVGASDLLFMAAVADQVAIALDRSRQFSSEARTDHLTGLANRREFERIMEREVALAERHNRRLALMMIDLDNLKRINDHQGHSSGDAALRLVAQQLMRVVRTSDICARLGGDEFGVAMPEIDLGRAQQVASRLRAALGEASLAARSREPIEVSVGLTTWRPGQDWQATYEVADGELYEDKRRRKAQRSEAQERPGVPIRKLGRTGRRRLAGN
ncbi:MAG TPA: sensor domain-containing diguanylate cyclase [Candidatus Angelobacter sp.]|nr:sensor domain-containing diguanylate cyclase [Candidatus Angelobacter sp.]